MLRPRRLRADKSLECPVPWPAGWGGQRAADRMVTGRAVNFLGGFLYPGSASRWVPPRHGGPLLRSSTYSPTASPWAASWSAWPLALASSIFSSSAFFKVLGYHGGSFLSNPASTRFFAWFKISLYECEIAGYLFWRRSCRVSAIRPYFSNLNFAWTSASASAEVPPAITSS